MHSIPPAPKKTSDQRLEWVILTCLFLVGMAVRLPYLSRCSLWYDETWRVALAEAPLKSPLRMPLVWFNQVFSYTGLLRLDLNLFGHSEWAVRLMSGLSGALAVPATYRLARFVLSRKAAL